MPERLYRDFYRILEGPAATLHDFTSFHALGRPLRRQTPELLRRWRGISLYATEAQARATALWRPSIGRYIALVRIEEGAPIYVEQTGDPASGHHTAWGEPAEFRARVVWIVPVQV